MAGPNDFSYGGFTFQEQALTGSADRGASIGFEQRWVVRHASAEPSTVAQAFSDYLVSQSTDPGLWDIQASRLADEFFLVVAGSKARKTTYKSFSTMGGMVHLNQSFGTRNSYAASGTPPNYQGAIGVSDSDVAGVDVPAPAFQFQIRKRFKYVSDAYLETLGSVTGAINSTTFKNRPAGSVLFLGAEGGEDDANYVDVNYHFAERKNQTGLVIGSITGINKRGWDYLWVRHREKVVGDLILQVPQFVYVEQVSFEADLNVLGV